MGKLENVIEKAIPSIDGVVKPKATFQSTLFLEDVGFKLSQGCALISENNCPKNHQNHAPNQLGVTFSLAKMGVIKAICSFSSTRLPGGTKIFGMTPIQKVVSAFDDL